MRRPMQGAVLGTLALIGMAVATVDVQAMPVQHIGPAASTSTNIDHVWWRGGYGYGWRRPFYGYGGYGYGWRPRYYGYGGWGRGHERRYGAGRAG